ncbi:hypothetical protein LINGRAHAP2_LOCUS32954, partial [Linum grandiflorum]
SFLEVSTTVSSFPSSPSPRLHSNCCTILPIDVQAINIAWRAPVQALFPLPNAIVLCSSVDSDPPLRNLSGTWYPPNSVSSAT